MFIHRTVMACAAVLAVACSRGISEQDAARIAQQLVNQRQGEVLEVMQVRPVGGLHKVTFRAPPDQYVDVFISQDGTHFSDSVRSVAAEQAELAADRQFAQCLKTAGVSLLVGRNHAGSQQQLLDLGRFAASLAIACDDDQENCKKLGVEEFPTLRHDGKLYGGRRTVPWVETLTGCKR